MKVIKEGKPTKVYQRYRLSCPVCYSDLEASEDELESVMLMKELHYGFVCPVCHGKVAIKANDVTPTR